MCQLVRARLWQHGVPWRVHARDNVTIIGSEDTPTGVGWRAEDNCDLLLSNLDSLNKGANDLPFGGPVYVAEFVLQVGSKFR